MSIFRKRLPWLVILPFVLFFTSEIAVAQIGNAVLFKSKPADIGKTAKKTPTLGFIGGEVLYENYFDQPPFDWTGMVPQHLDGWKWYSGGDFSTTILPPCMRFEFTDNAVPDEKAFTSPPVDVSGHTTVIVAYDGVFRYLKDNSSNSDYLVVEISRDGGASWEEVERTRDQLNGVCSVSTNGASEILVRFRYDDSAGGSQAVDIRIDDFQVVDVEPPSEPGNMTVYEVHGPLFGVFGLDHKVGMLISSQYPLSAAYVEYGTFDGENVTDVQTTNLNKDYQFPDRLMGYISGSYGAPGLDVAWHLVAVDIWGQQLVWPAGSGTPGTVIASTSSPRAPDSLNASAYGFHLFELDPDSWNEFMVRDGNFWTPDAPWSFNPQVIPPNDLFSPPPERETIQPGMWDPTPMFGTVPNGPYPDNADGYLTLNMDIVPGPNSIFAWYYLIDCQASIMGGTDGYNVEIQVDGGSWNIVQPIGGYPTTVLALNFYDPGFSGLAGPTASAIDLSPYEGHTVNLRFHFAGDSGNDRDYYGVSIYQMLLSGVDVPGWLVNGSVTDANSDPIVDAQVDIWPSGADYQNDPPVLRTHTNSDGTYRFFPLSTGDYILQAVAPGLEPLASTSVTVTDTAGSQFDFQPGTTATDHDFAGQVVGEDSLAGIDGVTLGLEGTGYVTTTAGGGAFDFGPIQAGTYNLLASSNPPGSQGYHDARFAAQVIGNDMPASPQYVLPAIKATQPPELTPKSHEIDVVIPNQTQLIVDGNTLTVNSEAKPPEPKTPPRKGYRVRLDGYRILPEVFPSRTFVIKGLENGHEYTVETAEDFGYGDEYLVWSDPMPATPNTLIATLTNPPINWVEIRPDSGGSGYDLYLGDYSDVSDIGGTFNYFGTDYTSLRVYGDGVISFDLSAQINYFAPQLGDPNPPNAIVAPYWTDLAPGYNSGESAWFWYDSGGNRAIIQWHAPHYTLEGPVNDADFEVILDFNDYSITFQYLTTESGWSPDALIGFEDPSGALIEQVNASNLVDGYTVQLASLPPAYGTISGHLENSTAEPIAGAAIEVVGQRPQTWSDGNGDWTITLTEGDYDLVINKPGYASNFVQNATVTASTDLPLGTQTMNNVSGSVDQDSLELSVPLEEASSFSTSFTLTNTGDAPMLAHAWWTMLPAYENDVAMGGGSSLNPPPILVKWVGNGESKRIRPVIHDVPATVRGPVATVTDLLEPLFHFNASTGIAPTVYDLFGVGVTNAGIMLSEYGSSTSLYQFSNISPYAFQSSVPFPDGVLMYNGFSLDMPNDCMVSVDSQGRVWRFNNDLSILEPIGNVGFDANGCAYNWMTNELYAYYWGDYLSGNPERFVVCDLNTGEIRDLPVPQGIGVVSDLAFVPNDPDGLYIYALTQYGDQVSIHRYNQRHGFWETGGKRVMNLPSEYDYVGGFYATPWFSMNESANKMDFVTEQRMDYVTTYVDEAGYTYVDGWRGPPVPSWLVIEGPTDPIAPAGNGTFTVTVDLSLDTAFTPTPETDTFVEIRPTAEFWQNPPVVKLAIHWGALGSGETANAMPERYALHPVYPNPFNPTATLKYDLPEPARVTMTVYNVLGREVAKLIDGEMESAGYHSVHFDGGRLAAGVYFVRFESEAYSKVRKMVLLK